MGETSSHPCCARGARVPVLEPEHLEGFPKRLRRSISLRSWTSFRGRWQLLMVRRPTGADPSGEASIHPVRLPQVFRDFCGGCVIYLFFNRGSLILGTRCKQHLRSIQIIPASFCRRNLQNAHLRGCFYIPKHQHNTAGSTRLSRVSVQSGGSSSRKQFGPHRLAPVAPLGDPGASAGAS